MQVRRFAAEDSEMWDAFCEDAYQATFLHSRRFLSYHGDRFHDRSLIILDDQGQPAGLFPAALHPTDPACVVSHPGITFGGLIHAGALKGEKVVEALSAIADRYRAEGAERLLYKAVPFFYHRVPAQEDLYGLFRLGAARVRCDLSSTIDLARRLPVSKRRRRSFAKSRKSGVEVVEGAGQLPQLWAVVEDNLARKHGQKPVHTAEEIILLAKRFPENIRCVCARLNGSLAAGVVLFESALVAHAQYIASSEIGYEVSALDSVFEHCIEAATAAGQRWFDFGISTEDGGRVLNESLYGFKSEFGSGAAVHEFYELRLR